MDVPFDPQDRIVDPAVRDELRVRRIGPRADRADRAGTDRADGELERLRAALADSTRRILELEGTLADTRSRLAERVQQATSLDAHRALASQLEAELAREREARRAAEDLLGGERERFSRVLAASQLELRDALDRARTEGRETLEAARAEASELREQLAAAAAELDRAAATSRAAAVERAALEQELRSAQAALAQRSDADDLRAELAARAAAQERAVAELSAVRPPPDREAGSRGLAPSVPPADHPALGNVADRAAVPDSVIADLARAAARLRELAPDTAAEPPPDAPKGPVAADAARRDDAHQPAVPDAADPSAPAVPQEVAATEATGSVAVDLDPAPPTDAAGPEAAGAAEERILPAPLPAQETAIPWLGPALAELAREDPSVAARLLLDLLPVQALWARRALTYEVAPEHGGRHLVHVDRGTARVERDVGWSAPAAVRIAGPVASLAPLVAGGRARPQGALVLGRKRKLRRLLRDARMPVGLPELARAGARPAPADLLALLAASVRPDRTRGTSALVTYVVGGSPSAAVVVADGAPLVVLHEPGDLAATAEVHTAPEDLLQVLAGAADARVLGDLDAVERLHRWLRAAQGLGA